jgi:LETM1 and EF-hand domain-containing protein 1, mitochondrial
MAMCRYMNLNTFGTDTMLRYQLRHHLRQIKRDDKAIAYEGVNSLSVPELQIATAARGIRTTGVSPAHLRDDLQQWLELRLKHGIPSTLLVLSNAYAYGQENRPDSHIENLRTTLSCLTDELVFILLLHSFPYLHNYPPPSLVLLSIPVPSSAVRSFYSAFDFSFLASVHR